jgi:hypothetical protein
MQKNQLRIVLVVMIFLLVGVIAIIWAKRGAAANSPARAPVEAKSPPETRAPDNAVARIQRAGAVTAIERGDYRGAIAALSSIVKAGNGVGDELELLRMAKELEEKYRKPAGEVEGPAALGEAPVEGPQRAPVVAPRPVVEAVRPSASPVRKPVAAPPPRPVVVARVMPAEPAMGLLLVTSVPTGLSVEIDGRRSEFTPLRKSLEVGPHQVVIFRRDEPVFRKTVVVTKDGVATVDADLTPEKPIEPEPRPAPIEPKPTPTPVEPKPGSVDAKPSRSANEPTPPPVSASVSEVGEVLVLQAGLVGDVFIQGVGYGPPPVLAKSLPVGEVSVELRADGSVKRKKTVVVEKGRRTNVQFR